MLVRSQTDSGGERYAATQDTRNRALVSSRLALVTASLALGMGPGMMGGAFGGSGGGGAGSNGTAVPTQRN